MRDLPLLRSSFAWYRRLDARAATGVMLLIALALWAVLVATTRVVTERSIARGSDDLEVARATFYRSLEMRAEAAATLTRVVAELPIFRAHMTDSRLAGDTQTMSAMADTYRRQLDAAFAIVTDGSGRWLAGPGWPEGTAPPVVLREQIEAATRASRRGIIPAGRDLFLAVSEPARFGDEVLGTFTIGYALDDGIATELAQITHCQVTFLSGGRLVASSLRQSERGAVAGLLMGPPQPQSVGPAILRLGRGRYIAGEFPLLRDQNAGVPDRLVLLEPWAPTQRFLNDVEIRFLRASGIVFVIALVCAVGFSRQLTRPLREIAVAAGDIASGNWTREVPVRGSAEATSVAVAFNRMTASLRGAQERLLHDAFHDPLTQLPNRALFMDRVQQLRVRRGRPHHAFAVLFVDLDRFKTVNDSLGHLAGDHLLLEVARRLSMTLRRDDTVARSDAEERGQTLARLGGDEFTVLIEQIRHPSDAVRIAERILDAVRTPARIGENDVFTTASIGVAVSTLERDSAEELVRDADLAMYQAKALGGDRVVVFDSTMHERAVERLRLETDLRRAIERQAFRLEYQPIVSLSDRRVAGFEALVRWQHPEKGLQPPSSFLPLAEETGLIVRIDQWVLREACAQARRWQVAFPDCQSITISVNVSAPSFGQPDLVRQVSSALRDTGLAPAALRLEITESAAMADAERARAVLADLKTLGVRVSLDDFGTGYSSLSYLQRFPVDTLKIDRSFIVRMEQDDCREIIRMILGLARTLGLEVIAEGTETRTQVGYLQSLQCACGQGYFFSRPLTPDAVDALLRSSAGALVEAATVAPADPA